VRSRQQKTQQRTTKITGSLSLVINAEQASGSDVLFQPNGLRQLDEVRLALSREPTVSARHGWYPESRRDGYRCGRADQATSNAMVVLGTNAVGMSWDEFGDYDAKLLGCDVDCGGEGGSAR
jgi:hypothetical protein